MLGRWRTALITQIILALTIIAVCWSRLVFEPWAMKISLGVIALIYIASTTACLMSKTSQTIPWLMTFCFILIFSAGLVSGFVFKQHWLGVEVYFIPSKSMQPTLQPEDIVLADTWVESNQLKVSDVIVFQHPSIKGMKAIKRISRINDDNSVRVLGDNPRNSLDSRLLGNIRMNLIEAKATVIIRGMSITPVKPTSNQ